ncbi:prepilin peptidase [Sulfitobacter guttiformis]|uniref:Type IV leader peptidase family protein n=1 Tax=Sulfitobacter guttiformis TaxID=74349 RepID=A0A420DTB9_9RHOB|nr:A24 family peptidase [Sulfitobacter guttiformis]KIN71052.1 Type 4 prepilin leader peptidase [Sulfitobacter guttiformis KCTC 32187]RKE97536.1 type IV leader peptidase family protein [Sulfitobacter guttiformis]
MTFFITAILILILARLIWIDLEQLRLPDHYTIPLVVAGLAISAPDGGVALLSSAIGGAGGFALFWLIGHYYFTRHGTEGLGLGDAKLFAASGTWLGALLLPQVLLVASLGGLAFALCRRGGVRKPLAFGPWLALGFITVWLKEAVVPLL